MKAITYEITRWVEIRFQRGAFEHLDRWYIVNRILGKGTDNPAYLTECGEWAPFAPKFFGTPEEALKYWNELTNGRPWSTITRRAQTRQTIVKKSTRCDAP